MKKLTEIFTPSKPKGPLTLSDVGGTDIIDTILGKVSEGKVKFAGTTPNAVLIGDVSISEEFLTEEQLKKIASAISAREESLSYKERKQQLMNLCMQLSNA